MKLQDIFKGWYHYLRAEPGTRTLMEKRMRVCDPCVNKEQVDGLGKVLAEVTNSANNLYRCKLCKCSLGALASLSDPACKIHKWDNL